MIDILVTGGAGFIGSNLVLALLREGKSVRVFDNNFRADPDNLKDVESDIEVITGDIRDLSQVRKALKDVKTVYHLAFINGTEYFYSQPRLVLEVGVKGTLNVIDAAIENGVADFILASSSEVYHAPANIPTSEDVVCMVPDITNPRFSYGGGKILGELLTLHYIKNKRIRRIIFRPHNIYGPKMGWEHVIPQLIKKIYDASSGFKKDEAVITIQGTGQESRSFCYIEDAIKGILICGNKGKDGQIYHLGNEDEVKIKELIDKIAKILNIKIEIECSPLREGSAQRRCPDITKLRSLGYSPQISLDEGLRKTIAWYKERLINGNDSDS